MAGNRVENLRAFDGARPRDQGQRAAADLDRLDGRLAVRADRDDGVSGMKLPAGELERLEDRQDLLDAGNGRQRLGPELVLVADDADDGADLAAAEVRLETQLADAFENVLDLLFGEIGSENDNHNWSGVRSQEPGLRNQESKDKLLWSGP